MARGGLHTYGVPEKPPELSPLLVIVVCWPALTKLADCEAVKLLLS